MSSSAKKLKFSKYDGLGNAFILIDGVNQSVDSINWSKASVTLCDRVSGIGADGVIFVCKSNIADLKMVIYNADGSIPEMCGNGLRCVAIFAWNEKLIGVKSFSVETGAGVLKVTLCGLDLVDVDMGEPILGRPLIPVLGEGEDWVVEEKISVQGNDYYITAVSLGNPHAVIFDVDLRAVPLLDIGPKIEHLPLFPNRVNVEFVEILSKSHAKMRVWERGAGETQACGTGACAVLVAGVLTKRLSREATITLPGGDLEIRWCEQTNHVWMKGPVSYQLTDYIDSVYL